MKECIIGVFFRLFGTRIVYNTIVPSVETLGYSQNVNNSV